jgi:hypothetical protein
VLAGLGGGALAGPASLATKTPSTLIRAADFDHDGITDLALLGPGGVTIERGDGTGRFLDATTYAVGPDPTGLGVADVDGDGTLDLLVGNVYGDVLVLLGRGDGTFQPDRKTDRDVALAVLPAGTGPGTGTSSPAPGFVFSDQNLDRVVVTQGGTTTVLGDRSDGLLEPGQVQLADLNGDGIPDLIVVDSGGNDVRVYPGLGGGRFGAMLDGGGGAGFFTGTDPVGVTVQDVDGDGRPDLVVANEGSNDVSILLNQATADGGFTFAQGPRLQAGVGPRSTLVQDVNGDGVPDILVSNGGSNDVSLLTGLGDGSFNDNPPRTFAVGSNPGPIFVGRFAGSPGLDLVAVNSGSDNVTLISNFTGGSPVSRSFPTGGADPVAAFAVTFTGEGLESLVIANEGDGQITLLGGTDGLNVEAVLSSPGLTEPTAVVLAAASRDAVEFYAATAGLEDAFALVLALPLTGSSPASFIPGGLPLLIASPSLDGEANAVVAVARLLPLNETSLALAGTLLTVMLETPAGEANAAAPGPGVLVVLIVTPLAATSSAGQSFSTDPGEGASPNDEVEVEVEGQGAQAASPVAQAPMAWANYVIGVDVMFERFRQAGLKALAGGESPADAGGDEVGGAAVLPARGPDAPDIGADTVEAPEDRLHARAVDGAIDTFWEAALPPVPRQPRGPIPTETEMETDPQGEGPVASWVPLVWTAMMGVNVRTLARRRSGRRGSRGVPWIKRR